MRRKKALEKAAMLRSRKESDINETICTVYESISPLFSSKTKQGGGENRLEVIAECDFLEIRYPAVCLFEFILFRSLFY